MAKESIEKADEKEKFKVKSSDDPNQMVAQFQNYQQQMQSLLIQKESMKLQSIEADKALKELEKTQQKSAYKITGQIMISKPVGELKSELEEVKENIDIMIKSLEKSEERLTGRLKELQEKLQEFMK
jgi:prefoldin beta subunit